MACLIITGCGSKGDIVTGRRRRTVGIFLTRGGTRTPANESAAIRKVIAAIAAFTGELSCRWNFLATR
jgi:hypothetical protein